MFGRGSEEAAACREAGVPVYVVPGVTSAIAAPAAAGHSGDGARAGALVRGGDGAQAGPDGDEVRRSRARRRRYPRRADGPGRASRALAAQLVAAGRDPATPAACIQSATTPEQRVTRATLATIAAAADRDGLENPVVTVIGAVAALGDTEIAAGGRMPARLAAIRA